MSAAQGFSPRGYLEIALRRWPILAGAALVGVVAGLFAGGLTSAEYTAQSRVLVRAIVADPFQPNVRPGDTIDLATEIEQVTSTPVILAAAESLGEPDPDVVTIASRLEVTAVGDSQVLRIRYTAETPEEARDWAAAVTDAYLAHRQQRAEDLVSTLVAAIDAQVFELESSRVPDQADPVTEARLLELARQRSSLLALPTVPGEVLRPAELPTDPSGAPAWVGQLGAMSLTLLAGFGIAIAVDRADDRLRTSSEISAVAGPVLGTLDLAGEQDRPRSILRRRATSQSDAVSVVKLRLTRSSTRPIRRIVVTSATDGPPTVGVGAEIAAGLAGDGTPIVLIASGLRDRIGITYPSLDEVLHGRRTLEEALAPAGPEQPNLFMLEVGLGMWDAGSASGLDRVLRELASRVWGFVVVVPPILDFSAPGLELAAASDAVLLVVDESGADVGELTRAVDSIRSVGANFAGTVIARSPAPERFRPASLGV